MQRSQQELKDNERRSLSNFFVKVTMVRMESHDTRRSPMFFREPVLVSMWGTWFARQVRPALGHAQSGVQIALQWLLYDGVCSLG